MLIVFFVLKISSYVFNDGVSISVTEAAMSVVVMELIGMTAGFSLIGLAAYWFSVVLYFWIKRKRI